MAKAAITNKRGTAAKAAKAATRGKPAASRKPAAKAKPVAKAKKPAPKPAAKRGKPQAAKKRQAAVVSRGKGGSKAAPKSRPAKPVAKARTVVKAKPAPRVKPVAKARPAAKKAPVAQRPAVAKKSAAKSPVVARPAKSVVAPKTAAPVAAKAPTQPKSGGKVAVAVAVAPPKIQTPLGRHLRKVQQKITVKGNEVVRPTLPAGYKPSAKEPYMGPLQVEYFRQKLNKWRTDLVEESKQTIDNLRDEVRDVGDEAERATRETENSLELRTRDRYRKLISKIDKALRRIEEGEYGYCEETGEEIGLDRLGARPIATLCLDAQERWEHRQRQMGD